MSGNLSVECPACRFRNEFPQPYPYHAGFGDTAFLYNEAGNCTLTWGVYDPEYLRLVGHDADAWQPSSAIQSSLEERLPDSPRGDRWGFAFPARCGSCHAPIRGSMVSGERYYLEYPGSVIEGRAGLVSTLVALIGARPSA